MVFKPLELFKTFNFLLTLVVNVVVIKVYLIILFVNRDGIFDLKNSELELSESDISSHYFVIASTVSIIEVFNVFTNYSGLLYLNNSLENAQGSEVEIYDNNITNSNMDLKCIFKKVI